MTITSINNNPKNESRYARHRSVWKGRRNQVQETVEAIRQQRTVYEYLDHPYRVMGRLSTEWKINFRVSRVRAYGKHLLGQWKVGHLTAPVALWKAAQPLHGDMALLWDDFALIVGRRIGNGTDLGGYSGESLVVFSFGNTGFDIVFSKYGYGETTRESHHFFHWQSRLTGLEDVVDIDAFDELLID